jgi:uncharacterized membrane protein
LALTAGLHLNSIDERQARPIAFVGSWNSSFCGTRVIDVAPSEDRPMPWRTDESCAWVATIGGAIFVGGLGALIGLAVGGPPGGVIGGLIGAVIGFVGGGLVCWRINKASHPGTAVTFAVPTLTGTVTASPSPARVGQKCHINFSFNAAGNSDNADCKIEANLTADAGTPASATPFVATNNASSFGQAIGFDTVWPAPSDGRRVVGTLRIIATKGSQSATIDLAPPAETRVIVLP